jgi:undecaprenyl pyrophosphate synthase
MCYKQKQMALCVRYVKNLDVVERFLGFIDGSKNQNAESLYDYILWYLKKCKLSSKPQIHVHFSHLSKNEKLTEIQTKLGIKHTTMIRLSDTRWNCYYRNIESVKNSYKAIIQALEEEIEN